MSEREGEYQRANIRWHTMARHVSRQVAKSERMAAYNWIEVEASCPACQALATIRCQTHIASSFDGDGSGRFCHRTYRLGEAMAWWTPDDNRFSGWSADADPKHRPAVEEACYALCEHCKAELYAVIAFENLVPRKLLATGLERDWPDNYSK